MTTMASSSTTTTEDKRFLTKHGYPKGFRFVPTHLELITILSRKIHSQRINRKVTAIFHELSILQHHPEELYDQFKADKEDRYIYFFSRREFQKSAAGAAAGGAAPVHRKRQRGGQDENENEPRPSRVAKGGGWKPSGGGQELRWAPRDKGGFLAGKMVTMVFYENNGGKDLVKSPWGMHEFTVPVDQQLLPKVTKSPRMHDLALYRLYRLNDKSDDMEGNGGAGSNQTLPANVVSAADHGQAYLSPAPAAGAGQPAFGVFNDRNQPLLATSAGASTSRMPPPPQQQQQQRRGIPNVGHPQYYYHHQQYRFGGAAPANAAAHPHQRVHAMTTMPPAYGAGMLPGHQHQLFQFPRPTTGTGLPLPACRQSFQVARPTTTGTGLPAPQPFQFARPPPLAPAQMPVYGGAWQQASHSGATRSLPSAPASSTPPPAAELPSAEELAPMAVTHGGAGQEAGGSFGAAAGSSPAATGSRPAEQDASATALPGQHVQSAGCVKPEEEVLPQILADNYDDGIWMIPDLPTDPDWETNPRYSCTMDELFGLINEAPLTKAGNN